MREALDVRRLLWAGLFAVAVLVAVRVLVREQLDPQAALATLRSVQARPWAIPAFLLAYLLGTAALMPALLFHLISGATYGFAHGVVLNLVACNLSATVHFLAARALGRRRLEPLLAHPRLKALDGAAARRGARAVVLIRCLPLPHVGVNAAAALSSMRWRDFALGSLVGTLPPLVVYTWFASSLVEGAAGARERALLPLAVASALLLTLSWLTPWLARKLAAR